MNEDVKKKLMELVNIRDFEKARELGDQACKNDASDAELWFLLGAIHGELKNFEAAEKCCKKVTHLRPDMPTGHYNLAVAYRNLGNIEGALSSLEKAIDLNAEFTPALYELGNINLELERFDVALKYYDRIIKISSDSYQVFSARGIALERLEEDSLAIESFSRSLQLNSSQPDINNRLGKLYERVLEYGKAEQCYKNMLNIDKDDVVGLSALSLLYKNSGKLDKALELIKRAVVNFPESKEVAYNYALILAANNKYSDAIKIYEDIIAEHPGFVPPLVNLGNIYLLGAKIEKAHQLYKKAYEIDPENQEASSNMLMSLNYLIDHDAGTIIEKHLDWGKYISRKIKQIKTNKTNNSKIRVGYVSPDFRMHSVAYYFHPLLKYASGNIENYCYSDVRASDEMTDSLKEYAYKWRDTYSLSDEKLIQKITDDRIDILVDLCGHMSGNRLRVFAEKPANIQITYLGYPNTTGLDTIDYRIVDEITDPIDSVAELSEERLYIPYPFVCYSPPMDSLEITDTPALENNSITFGSFNNLAKINKNVITLWSEILNKVPGSRLYLKAAQFSDEGIKSEFLSSFDRHGVASDRITLVEYADSVKQHLNMYSQIDIALDTFPYNGTTTTCEALWMGVPVVVLKGGCHAGRVGETILTAIDMSEHVTADQEEYVNVALDLASDYTQLNTIRKNMREKVIRSRLTDGAEFVSEIEQQFERIIADHDLTTD